MLQSCVSCSLTRELINWGGGGILVGGWGGINFQGLQKFHSNIGRNACLTYRYLISNFFS